MRALVRGLSRRGRASSLAVAPCSAVDDESEELVTGASRLELVGFFALHAEPATNVALQGSAVVGEDDERDGLRIFGRQGPVEEQLHEALSEAFAPPAVVNDDVAKPKIVGIVGHGVDFGLAAGCGVAVSEQEQRRLSRLGPFNDLAGGQRPRGARG